MKGVKLDEAGGSLSSPKLHIEIRFEADGKIAIDSSGPNAALLGVDAPQMLSEGCTGPVQKSCALITLSYLMALGNPDSAQEVEPD